MENNWAYFEFSLNASATLPFRDVIAGLFQVAVEQVKTKQEFWDAIGPDSPLLIGYELHSMEADTRFPLYLNVEANRWYEDYYRLPCGVQLAQLTGMDVAVGDYTSRCEYLIIKPDGYVHYTSGVETGGRLDITEQDAAPVHYLDFPKA